jgi:hypothetical protein
MVLEIIILVQADLEGQVVVVVGIVDPGAQVIPHLHPRRKVIMEEPEQ